MGLRVDHIDGLYDPETYLERLQTAASNGSPEHPVYVVVEKILGRNEELPQGWAACGTTGYDFLNALNELMTDPGGPRELEAVYSRFTKQSESFAEVCYTRKKQVMRELFAAEVQALGHLLGKLAAQDWQARDLPLYELIAAMVEVTACLPVYRTYIRSSAVSRRDRTCIEDILKLARQRVSDMEVGNPAFDFLRRVLLLTPPSNEAELLTQYLRFVMRWQQFTGPVMAKGMEDTADYVHNSLISMNEVGSDSLRDQAPQDLAGFHSFLRKRSLHWPRTMNATSTHDTKRSEDVRARINVLSEFPREWEKCLLRWARLNEHQTSEVDGIAVPAPSEEVLLYQTLLGAWPFDANEEQDLLERVLEFLKKAVREAKTYSGWLEPNEAHERALLQFAKSIFRGESNQFRDGFLRFQRKVAWFGALNSLSQVLIKITAPGIPDFYQGCELWDLSMVDPDNRRPVDFRRRVQTLETIRSEHSSRPRHLLKDMLRQWQDGRVKLFLIDRALDFLRAHAEVYLNGAYTPLNTAGGKNECICAFARQKGADWCLTVVPRLTTELASRGRMPLGRAVWQETVLQLPEAAPDSWQNALTGDEVEATVAPDGQKGIALADVLRRFPVAILKANV